MHHRGLNKNIIAFLFLASLILLMWQVKNYASWGMDIGTYNETYHLVSYEEPYYSKEILSWTLIKIFADQFGDAKALSYALDFFLVFLAIKNTRSLLACVLVIWIVLIFPPYYLLSLNILRQWVSTLILTFCYFNYSGNKKLTPALFLSALAFFAHNSSIVLVLIYAICEFNLILALMLSIGMLAAQMLQVDLFSSYQDIIFQDINGYSDLLKKYFYAAIVFGQCIGSFLLTKNKEKFGLALVALIITTLPMSDWMLERLLLTVLFVSTFEFATCFANNNAGIAIRAYCYLLLSFSFAMTLLHSGVSTIING